MASFHELHSHSPVRVLRPRGFPLTGVTSNVLSCLQVHKIIIDFCRGMIDYQKYGTGSIVYQVLTIIRTSNYGVSGESIYKIAVLQLQRRT